MVRPKYILEIGTYTGYSAICLAKGLTKDGRLYTVEANDEILFLSEKYFQLAGVKDKVTQLVGDALEIIPQLNQQFDLVFIDAEKTQYLDYYKMVIEKVPSGGVLLADNVLWDGKVVDPACADEPDTQGILEFNRYVQDDARVENVILPLRDGVSLIRKL